MTGGKIETVVISSVRVLIIVKSTNICFSYTERRNFYGESILETIFVIGKGATKSFLC